MAIGIPVGFGLQRGAAIGRALRQKRRSFTPHVAPTRPPAGFYDPALDAQERASGRGLTQVIEDAAKQGGRAESQYFIDRQGVERQGSEGLSDLLRQRDRSTADFGTSRSRGTEDYNRGTADLVRRFSQLGSSQTQNAAAAGVGAGGALAAALKARAENQGREQGVMDTGFGRFSADLTRDETRFGQDSELGEQRLRDATTRDLGATDMQYGYGVVDREDAVGRAQKEATAFGQDIGAQRLYQAGQLGFTLPKPPKNEFTDPKTSKPYRVVIRGNEALRVDPSGAILSRRKRSAH